MNDQPSLTTTEWQLLVQLLERERGELPAEIHHSVNRETKEHLKQRLQTVRDLLSKLADASVGEAGEEAEDLSAEHQV